MLSSIVGIGARSTVDIDLHLHEQTLLEHEVREILTEILRYSEEDSIAYEVFEVVPIRQNNRHGGLRIPVLCRLENIRQVVPLDIAVGDVITPAAMDYQYAAPLAGIAFQSRHTRLRR